MHALAALPARDPVLGLQQADVRVAGIPGLATPHREGLQVRLLADGPVPERGTVTSLSWREGTRRVVGWVTLLEVEGDLLRLGPVQGVLLDEEVCARPWSRLRLRRRGGRRCTAVYPVRAADEGAFEVVIDPRHDPVRPGEHWEGLATGAGEGVHLVAVVLRTRGLGAGDPRQVVTLAWEVVAELVRQAA